MILFRTEIWLRSGTVSAVFFGLFRPKRSSKGISMNRIGIVIAFLLLVVSAPAYAESGHFYQNSGFWVNQDFYSGLAFGVAQGTNAVPIGISSSINYVVTGSGAVTIYTGITVSGIWGNPDDYSSPYYAWLSQNGLHTHNSFQLAEFNWNGKWYEFNELVGLTQQGQALIAFNEDNTSLTGWFSATSTGQGAIPIQSWSSVQIFEPGHPFETDWQVSISSKWIVTSGFQLMSVPSPGALTLLGLAGLLCRRRRRN
jgi:MYXO-CTERM domain-containing protein